MNVLMWRLELARLGNYLRSLTSVPVLCRGKVASRDAENAPKLAQVNSLEGPFRIAEEGTLLMSATICELSPESAPAAAARSCFKVALCLAESQIKSSVHLSRHFRRRWVNNSPIEPVLKNSASHRLELAVVLTTY